MHLEGTQLIDLLTGTDPPPHEWADHLAGCRACRREMAALESTWEALGRIEPPAAPEESGYADLRREAAVVGSPSRPRFFGRGILRAAAVILALAAVGVLAQVALDEPDARATAVVPNADEVVLRVDRGDVRIEAHSASFARIETFAAGDVAPVPPTITSEGGRVVVDHSGGSAVRLIVQVPERAEVDLRLGRGQVDLAGLAGRTLVTVGRGDLTGRLRPPRDEPVTLSTRAGDIDVAVPADLRSEIVIACPRGEVESEFPYDGAREGGAPFELIANDGNCTLRRS